MNCPNCRPGCLCSPCWDAAYRIEIARIKRMPRFGGDDAPGEELSDDERQENEDERTLHRGGDAPHRETAL